MVLKLSILTLKLLKVLKSRLCFKERWQISRVNNLKTITIKNAQFPRFCFYKSICVPGNISLRGHRDGSKNDPELANNEKY